MTSGKRSRRRRHSGTRPVASTPAAVPMFVGADADPGGELSWLSPQNLPWLQHADGVDVAAPTSDVA